MKRRMSWLGGLFGLVCLSWFAWTSSGFGDELQPGDMAPDFELPGSDGKTYRLSDYRDQQPVILAWFPKAFTGG